jgi:cytochrome c peroxidase
LPPDPSNRWAADPRAAALGKALFFDTRFSANGSVACASCHMPNRQLQDDLPVGAGIAKVKRRTMPLAGTGYQEFLFWNGRKDSQWSQALGPLESAAEHGSDRIMAVQLIAANYLDEYELLFGKLPKFGKLPAHASQLGSPEAIAAWQALDEKQQYAVNLDFTNMGKAIAAFERTIPVPVTRFDAYAAAIARGDWQKSATIFNQAERNGLKVFLNDGDCVRCRDGPQFTGMRFFSLGLPGTDAIAAWRGPATALHAQRQIRHAEGRAQTLQRPAKVTIRHQQPAAPARTVGHAT